MSRYLALVLTLAFFASGCLKTRAQLKEEGSDVESGKPIPAQVQDVQPQGGYVIDEMKSEITKLSGRIEDLERAHKQAGALENSAAKEEFKKFETRMVELEHAQTQMIEALKKMQESAPANQEDPSLFERAKRHFDEEEYEATVEALTSYLKFPKAKKAESATFLRAEAYFNLKQFKKAIVDYSKFPENYAKSKKVPQALLRIGASFDALGMKEDAKGFYQELVDKYPKSPEAQKAKAKLK